MGKVRNAYKIVAGKPDGKKTHRRRRGASQAIQNTFQGNSVRCCALDLSGLGYDMLRFVSVAMKFLVP
jgi:hypothetical protein